MTKRRIIKICAFLLAFIFGFLVCLLTVKSDKQEWTETDAKRARQVERLRRLVEQMNEDCEEMVTYNEEAVVRPEEGK